jgi:hypothetical protein
MNYCHKLARHRQEPAPAGPLLVDGETMRFDGKLWDALPQRLKNQFPRARGHWFRSARTSECTFAVVMTPTDAERFLALVMQWLQEQQP